MDLEGSEVESNPDDIGSEVTIKAQPMDDMEPIVEVEVKEEETEIMDPLDVEENYQPIDVSSTDEMSSCNDTDPLTVDDETSDEEFNIGEEVILKLDVMDSTGSREASNPLDQADDTPSFSSELYTRRSFYNPAEELRDSAVDSGNWVGVENDRHNHREVKVGTTPSAKCTSSAVSGGSSLERENPSSTSQLRIPEANLNNGHFSKSKENLDPPRHSTESTNSCICTFSKVQFSALPKEEQISIFFKGRPTPPLPHLICRDSRKIRSNYLIFSPASYDRSSWLAGCAAHRSLNCFPCLLFSYLRDDTWVRGVTDLSSLEMAARKHRKSKAHLFACIEWMVFKDHNQNNLSVDLHLNIANKRETVLMNKRALKWIIDQVCTLANHESALYRHVISNENNNKGNYAGFLEAEFHCHIKESLKSATLLKETSSTVHSNLISSIADVILDCIKLEISESPFVALVIEETSSVVGTSQLSTVLRSADDKFKQHDRFIGFADFGGDRSAASLSDYIKTISTDYGLAGKLVAQTYNGAVVQAGQLNDLIEKVKAIHGQAYFIHSSAFPLRKIIQQSTYCILECKMFYKTISGVADFFSKSSEKLKELIRGKLRHPTYFDLNSKLIQTVDKHRIALIQFFDYIAHSDDSSTEQVIYARLFRRFLLQFDTLFFLDAFSRIFDLSDQLENALNCSTYDTHQKKIEQFHSSMLRFKRYGFDSIWANITGHSTDPESKKPRLDNVVTKYSEIFDQIVQRALEQTEARFRDVDKFQFPSLIDSSKFDHYLTTGFPHHLYKNLCESYQYFDVPALRAELTVFYSNYARFQGFLSMADGLSQFFPELSMFLKLLITIPPTASNIVAIHGSDKTKTISSIRPGPVTTNYSVIAVEHELLTRIRSESLDGEDFYASVISKFAHKNPHIELVA